jgi:hypothetical protein
VKLTYGHSEQIQKSLDDFRVESSVKNIIIIIGLEKWNMGEHRGGVHINFMVSMKII